MTWSGSSGAANLTSGSGVNEGTLFPIASVTKTYVATLTLRLVEGGRLGLQDTVGQWLGDRVAPGVRAVQVRQLLQMTSGLGEYLEEPHVLRWLADPNHRWTPGELLKAIAPPRHPGVFPFRYCNSNFVLLGAVDARAGGEPVAALLSHLVLDPLGLKETYLQRVPRLTTRFAHGYELLSDGGRVDTFTGAGGVPTSMWGPLFTDGGIGTDAREVALFANALYGGRLLSGPKLATMLEPVPDSRGAGMGSETYLFDGHEWHGHYGSFGGFSTISFTDISRALTIVVLTNGMPRDEGVPEPAEIIWRALARQIDVAAAD